uniref:Uncharacterized protein n=1 Tax=Plectus sambesii TaxID=2011161 RepID=A0A914UJG9_9BILA
MGRVGAVMELLLERRGKAVEADHVMRWATMFCLHAGFLAKKKLEEIMDVVNMTRYVPALTEISATALNMEGYKLESPLERNW